jgi:hypothetical protein
MSPTGVRLLALSCSVLVAAHAVAATEHSRKGTLWLLFALADCSGVLAAGRDRPADIAGEHFIDEIHRRADMVRDDVKLFAEGRAW